MSKKYYAVKKGYQTGIYTDWSECEKQVKNYSDAEYKGFQTIDEAKEYLENSKIDSDKLSYADKQDLSGVHIYVDGSYSDTRKIASYGFIVIEDDKEIYRDFNIVRDNIETRNVAGELTGVISALKWAKEYGYKNICIHYDYEGIEKWATGSWKTNNNRTSSYKTFIESIKHEIVINFVKVKAHTGDKYNELADTLAKHALSCKNKNDIVNNNDPYNKSFSITDTRNVFNNLINHLTDTFEVSNRQVKNGIQYVISHNKEQFFITYYDNMRVLFQGKPCIIYEEIIVFLSSIDNITNEIKKMNESFYNFKSEEIDLKYYLPKSYNIFPHKLFVILQPSLLEKPTYELQDYSMYIFPALRALEGSLKYLLAFYGIEININNKKYGNFVCFDGNTCKLQSKYRKIIENKNKNLVEYIENMYKYYKNNRHPIFHTNSLLDEIKTVENYGEVRIYIKEILGLLDEAFYLHNLNG